MSKKKIKNDKKRYKMEEFGMKIYENTVIIYDDKILKFFKEKDFLGIELIKENNKISVRYPTGFQLDKMLKKYYKNK